MAKRKAARAAKKAKKAAPKKAGLKKAARKAATRKAARKQAPAKAKVKAAGRKKVATATARKAAPRRKAVKAVRPPARKTAGPPARTARPPARKTVQKTTARRPAAATGAARRPVPAKAAASRPGPAKTVIGRPAPTKRPIAKAAKNAPPPERKAPSLNRARRVVMDDEIVSSPPSTLDMDRTASAARSGRKALHDRLEQHHETGPGMTGGDVDADWESAYSVGDEAPGGDNPTPDQDIVDEIGRALGNEYQDNEPLKGADKISARDKHRWELDPGSKEDFDDRDVEVDVDIEGGEDTEDDEL